MYVAQPMPGAGTGAYDWRVTLTVPRPPLLRRLPPWAWTALAWCAAALVALVLLGTMSFARTPVSAGPGHLVGLKPWDWAGLSVAMAVPIGFALRRPVLILALVLAESAAYAVVGGKTWPLLAAAIALVCHGAATRSRRASAAAAVLASAVFTGEFWAADAGPNTHLSDELSTVVSVSLAFAVGWMIGNSIRRQREYAAALHAQTAGRAVIAERLRIARELHDQVAHSIGIIALQSGAARRALEAEPAGARAALGAIEDTSRETLAGLRRMLGALREAQSHPDAAPSRSDRGPGLADLERLAAAGADAGVRVEVRWRGQRRPLPLEVDLSAYRIIQESVTNVVRHAGTGHCRVLVDYRDEELAIEIVDDGNGALVEGTGYGIPGMRERVSLLHGRFRAGPRPECGFLVAAQLPVRAGALR
jgi:signal transduction histidine kinase